MMAALDHPPASPERTHTAGDLTAPADGIPALVVSGFLGAGKTTLVRHLLKEAQAQGTRLAVVSNEFGALGIDQALLGSQAGSHYVELEGGCVCCKLSDEFVITLQRIWEDRRPDRIIVETSGVALPFDTLLNFWREPVAAWVGACVSVVVVNAEQVAEGRDLEGVFEQQVSSADLLILNKMDLIDPERCGPVETLVRNLAQDTPVIQAVNAAVSTLALFPPDSEHVPKRTGNPSNHEPHFHETYEPEELVIEHGIKPEVLIRRIQSSRALRAKGFVRTSDGLRLVQGVGPRVDLIEPAVHPSNRLIGRVVLIRKSRDSVQ